MSGSSMWASLECHCCFWIARGLVSYLTMWLLTLQLFKNSIDTQEKLRLNLHSLSVSELLEYWRFACILKGHSHSNSGGSIWASLECQFCFWTAGGLVSYLTMWLLTLQLFKNRTDTQEKLRLNLHSLSVSDLLEYRRKSSKFSRGSIPQTSLVDLAPYHVVLTHSFERNTRYMNVHRHLDPYIPSEKEFATSLHTTSLSN
jgi:hypothetical protein